MLVKKFAAKISFEIEFESSDDEDDTLFKLLNANLYRGTFCVNSVKGILLDEINSGHFHFVEGLEER